MNLRHQLRLFLDLRSMSAAELARASGVSKQVISRYEESDYQTVAIVRLQEILDAIGIKTVVTFSALTVGPCRQSND